MAPIGTSLIRSASMMIGMGHFRPSASIVSMGAGRVGGVIRMPLSDCAVCLLPPLVLPLAAVPITVSR